MKRILILLSAAMLFGISASAEKVGEALSTDIVTFIDGSPIESYNYLDYTYIVAEDLRNYGFDVDWDADVRRLDITRPERNFTPYIDDFINEIKSYNLFVPVFDVYATDIKAYINGEPVQSYNIDGRTIINTDALQAFGICTYDNDKRRYDVDILSREIEGCEAVVVDEYNEEGYGGKTTETGFFENSELVYGKRVKSSYDRFGEYVMTERGNFAECETLEYENNFKRAVQETCIYKTTDKITYTCFDDSFVYGRFVACERRPDGSERRYLRANGELYFKGNAVNAALYSGSRQIYNGEIRKDTINVQTGETMESFAVIYAPGYSEGDGDYYGIIYYYPENDYDGGYIFYRGDVKNGVAHGQGAMYRDNGEAYPLVYNIEAIDSAPLKWLRIDSNLIYDGSFANGLPDGYGMIFSYGELVYDGDMQMGKKSGQGREYSSWSQDTIYSKYEGGFENGRRSGEGTEYGMTFDGIWKRFEGNWQNGSWESGKWYELNSEGQPELYYEGEFRYDGERQYGTYYKYYNEETGEYEVKTGWFADWVYVGE